MVISVNFYGLQRKLTRTDQIQIPLFDKTRVSDLLGYVKRCYPDLPLDEDAFLVTVNNEVSSMDQILKGDDHISFIPHLGGG